MEQENRTYQLIAECVEILTAKSISSISELVKFELLSEALSIITKKEIDSQESLVKEVKEILRENFADPGLISFELITSSKHEIAKLFLLLMYSSLMNDSKLQQQFLSSKCLNSTDEYKLKYLLESIQKRGQAISKKFLDVLINEDLDSHVIIPKAYSPRFPWSSPTTFSSSPYSPSRFPLRELLLSPPFQMQKVLNEQTAQLRNLSQQVYVLENDNQELVLQNEAILRKKDKLDAEVKKLQEGSTTLREQLENEQLKWTVDEEAGKKEMARLRRENKDMKLENERLQKELESVVNLKEDFGSKLRNIRNKHTLVQDERNRLQDEVLTLRQALSQNQSLIEAQATELIEVRKELGNLESLLMEGKTPLNCTMEESFEALSWKAELAAYQKDSSMVSCGEESSDAANTENILEETKAQVESLKVQMCEIEDLLQKEKDLREKAEEQNIDYKKRINTAMDDVIRVQGKSEMMIQSLKEEIAALQEKSQTDKNATNELQKVLNEVESSSQKTIESLRAEVESRKSQLKTLKEELEVEQAKWLSSMAAKEADLQKHLKEKDVTEMELECVKKRENEVLQELEKLKQDFATQTTAWEEEKNALKRKSEDEVVSLQEIVQKVEVECKGKLESIQKEMEAEKKLVCEKEDALKSQLAKEQKLKEEAEAKYINKEKELEVVNQSLVAKQEVMENLKLEIAAKEAQTAGLKLQLTNLQVKSERDMEILKAAEVSSQETNGSLRAEMESHKSEVVTLKEELEVEQAKWLSSMAAKEADLQKHLKEKDVAEMELECVKKRENEVHQELEKLKQDFATQTTAWEEEKNALKRKSGDEVVSLREIVQKVEVECKGKLESLQKEMEAEKKLVCEKEDALKSQLAKEQKLKEEAEAKYINKETELEVVNQSLVAKQEVMENLKLEIAAKEAQTAGLKLQLTNLQVKSERDMEILKAAEVSSQETNGSLRAEMESHKSEVVTLKEELEVEQAKWLSSMAAKEADLQKHLKEKDVTEMELECVKKRENEVHQELEKLKQDFATQTTAWEEEKNALKRKSEDEVVSLREIVQKVEVECKGKLESIHKEMEAEKKLVCEKEDALKSQLAKEQKLKEEAEAKYINKETELEVVNQSLVAKQEVMENLKLEIAAKEAQTAGLKLQLTNLQVKSERDMEILKAAEVSSQETNGSLRAEMESHKSEVVTLKEELEVEQAKWLSSMAAKEADLQKHLKEKDVTEMELECVKKRENEVHQELEKLKQDFATQTTAWEEEKNALKRKSEDEVVSLREKVQKVEVECKGKLESIQKEMEAEKKLVCEKEDALKSQLAKEQKLKEEAEAKYINKETELEVVNQSLVAKQEVMGNLKLEFVTKEAQTAGLKLQLTNLQVKSERDMENLKDAVSSSQETIGSLRAEAESLKSQLKILKEEMKVELKHETQALLQKEKDLKQKAEAQSIDCEKKINTAMEDVMRVERESERTIQSLKEEIAALQEKSQADKNAINQLKTTYRDKVEAIAAQVARSEDLEREKQGCVDKYTVAKRKLGQTLSDLARAEAEKERLKNEIHAFKDRVSKLIESLQEAGLSKKALASRVTKLEDERQPLKDKVLELENELKRVRAQNLSLDAQLKVADATIRDLRRQSDRQSIGGFAVSTRGPITSSSSNPDELDDNSRTRLLPQKRRTKPTTSTVPARRPAILPKDQQHQVFAKPTTRSSARLQPSGGRRPVSHTNLTQPTVATRSRRAASASVLLPTAGERSNSHPAVVEEELGASSEKRDCSLALDRSVPKEMVPFFDCEDEEREFNNHKYLRDLEAGRCKVDKSCDWRRVSELQHRNSLYPPHLRSAYPAEMQFQPSAAFTDDQLREGCAVADANVLDLTAATENLELRSPAAANLRKRKSFSDSTGSRSSSTASTATRKSKRLSYSRPGPPTPGRRSHKDDLDRPDSSSISSWDSKEEQQTPQCTPRSGSPSTVALRSSKGVSPANKRPKTPASLLKIMARAKSPWRQLHDDKKKGPVAPPAPSSSKLKIFRKAFGSKNYSVLSASLRCQEEPGEEHSFIDSARISNPSMSNVRRKKT